MATIPYQQISAPPGKVSVVVWRGLAAGDEGDPYIAGPHPLTVQMSGDFGGSVVLQGSLSKDGAWATLTDQNGAPVSRGHPGIVPVTERPYLVRPIAGGGVKSVDVWLLTQA